MEWRYLSLEQTTKFSHFYFHYYHFNRSRVWCSTVIFESWIHGFNDTGSDYFYCYKFHKNNTWRIYTNQITKIKANMVASVMASRIGKQLRVSTKGYWRHLREFTGFLDDFPYQCNGYGRNSTPRKIGDKKNKLGEATLPRYNWLAGSVYNHLCGIKYLVGLPYVVTLQVYWVPRRCHIDHFYRDFH